MHVSGQNELVDDGAEQAEGGFKLKLVSHQSPVVDLFKLMLVVHRFECARDHLVSKCVWPIEGDDSHRQALANSEVNSGPGYKMKALELMQSLELS